MHNDHRRCHDDASLTCIVDIITIVHAKETRHKGPEIFLIETEGTAASRARKQLNYFFIKKEKGLVSKTLTLKMSVHDPLKFLAEAPLFSLC